MARQKLSYDRTTPEKGNACPDNQGKRKKANDCPVTGQNQKRKAWEMRQFGKPRNRTNEEEKSASEPIEEKESEKFYFPRIQFAYCKDCRYCDYIQSPFQAISKCWCNYYDRRVNGYETAWCTKGKLD